MSLTIDQILAESRGEIESPLTFTAKKEASAQPSISSFSDEEIEKMAGLLRQAEVSELVVNPEVSVNEKIAEALILSDFINNIVGVKQVQEKTASFRDEAIRAGYNPSEVDAFLEKQAKASALKNLAKSPATKAVAALAGLGGAGAIGHEVGEERTKAKAKKVMPLVYAEGRKSGFRQGATAVNEFYKQKLREMRETKE